MFSKSKSIKGKSKDKSVTFDNVPSKVSSNVSSKVSSNVSSNVSSKIEELHELLNANDAYIASEKVYSQKLAKTIDEMANSIVKSTACGNFHNIVAFTARYIDKRFERDLFNHFTNAGYVVRFFTIDGKYSIEVDWSKIAPVDAVLPSPASNSRDEDDGIRSTSTIL